MVCGGVGPNNQRQNDNEGYTRRVSPAPSRQPTSPQFSTQHEVACEKRPETSRSDRDPISNSERRRKKSKSLQPGILLPHFRSAQGIRKMASRHRPKGTQQIRALSALSNAYSALCMEHYKRWRLGFLCRLNRRLSPRPNAPGQLQVPPVCSGGKSAGVQSPTIRSEHSTTPLYPTSTCSRRLPPPTRYSDNTVPRRLVDSSPKSRNPPITTKTSSTNIRPTRPNSQCKEVQTKTDSGYNIPRSKVLTKRRKSRSSNRKNKLYPKVDRQDMSTNTGDLQTSRITHGCPQLGIHMDTIGPSESQTDPTIPQRQTTLGSPLPTQESRTENTSNPTFSLERRNFPSSRYQNRTLPSRVFTPHGCIKSRMGCASCGSSSSRNMESTRTTPPYQPLGAPGYYPSFTGPVFPGPWPTDHGMHGQYHCCCLHQSPGRHTVQDPPTGSLDPIKMVSNTEHTAQSETHTRPSECDRRQPVSITSNSPNRVATTSTSSTEIIQSVGNSTPGSLCNQIQQTTGQVYLASTRSTGTGSGCTINSLAGTMGVRISPSTSSIQSPNKGQGRENRNDIDSTTLASTAVVSTAIGTNIGLAKNTSTTPRFVISGRNYQCGKTVPSTRMEVISSFLTEDRGFSAEAAKYIAAPTRPSTAKSYDGKWQKWADWAEARNLDPCQAPVTEVAEFLLDLFKQGLAPQTIKGYKTSLSSVFKKIGRGHIINDQALSSMMQSFTIQKPRPSRTMPNWELGLVLERLKQKPYEPMREASLKYLTLKTVFLLALASGNRRSELQALMYNDEYCLVEKDGSKATIHFAPGFLRKNRSPLVADKPVVIKALPIPGRTDFGAILCPVRALRYYRTATRDNDIRRDRQRLFVPIKDNNQGQEISPDSISRWITSVISDAYQSVGNDQDIIQDLNIKAHEVRAVSTSLLKFQGANLQEIMQAGRWASGGTFIRFYDRDMVPQATQIAKTGPFVAAGTVIHPPTTTSK